MSAAAPDDAAVAAACAALAARLGLGPVQPRVIGRFSNLALALEPLPWVARVATGTAGPRGDGAHARRELRLTRHLARHGAPALPPAPEALAGPHRAGPWSVTLWPRLALRGERPDPAAAGTALAACHRALQSLPAQADDAAQDWAPLAEARRLLDAPEVRAVAAAADQARVARRLDTLQARLHAHPAPRQWLHGDAHLNNVVDTATGPCWLDWEDACRGPLEWDLAGLVASARVLGGPDAGWAEAALQGWRRHGRALDEALLQDCIAARTAFVVAWSWWLGTPDAVRSARLKGRLEWLAGTKSG